MAIAYIGIGSNIGDRRKNCLDAVTLLGSEGNRVLKVSSVCETEPWGRTGQPKFINLAVALETAFSPQQLLSFLKGIEQEMGRKTTARWGPRLIDLDILLYDDRVVAEEGLSIPHPLLHEREFVLTPLVEIAADVIHPVLREKISALRDRLSPGSR